MGATKNVLLVESDSGNYSEKVHATNSLLVSGTMTAGNVPVVQEDGTVVWTAGAINTVSSVFGRTGAITAQSGDYTKAQVGLGNVENTAISTWAGSSNLTTVGTITSGAISGITGINNTPIGASTPASGSFSSVTIPSSTATPLTIDMDNYYYVTLRGNQNSSSIGLAFSPKNSVGSSVFSYFYAMHDRLMFQAPLSGYIAFGGNNGSGGLSEQVRIDSSGNLCISATSATGRLTVKASTSDGSTDALNLQDSTGGEVAAVDSDGNADFVSLRTDATNAWKLYGEDTTANSTECKLKVNVAGTDYWISAVKAAA